MNEPRRAGIRRPAAGITLAAGRLTRLRNEKTMSRLELAAAAGISVQSLAAYEGGTRRPRADKFRKLCEALGCQASDLME